MCCGAGGARMWMDEKIGTRINVTRVEQALPQRPALIATACPYCTTMMGDGVRDIGQGDNIAVRDIAEIVADALLDSESRGIAHEPPTTAQGSAKLSSVQ